MKLQRFYGVPIGATLLTLIAQPAWAAPIQVTAIQSKPTSSGIQLLLSTEGGGAETALPSVFTVVSGNSAVADVAGAQLRLAGGKPFHQNNPAPGIAAIVASQLDANTVRVVVNGANQAPASQVIRRHGSGVVLGFTNSPVAQTRTLANLNSPPANPRPSDPPLVLPRAVAPPVGDIAVAPIDVSPETIELDTSERITKLLLREAPAREVLTLLGRAANINVAFAEGGAETVSPAQGQESLPGATGAATGEPKISLDIEDEPVQDVFNYVLRLSGLQANRVGRTVFVGKTLPSIAQNRIVRTYRLNQIKATSTGTITQTFTSQAETGGSVSAGSSSGGVSASSGATAQTAINRTTTTTRNIIARGAKEILQSYGANSGGTNSNETQVSTSTDSSETEVSTSDQGETGSTGRASATLLQGLEVVADARANTITLIGSPNSVQIATSLLTQLDIRRRQAAVNVKIVDVDLTKVQSSGADLNFNSTNTITSGFINGIFQIGAVLGNNFLLNLTASIQDNSAKILTNPTLIVQEGSSAQVNLTQEIFSGIQRETSAVGTDSLSTITETPIIRPAGVILNLNVDQIDDNGFVTLNIAPEVSAPNGTFTFSGGTGTLLAQRRLETGQLRLRDGQTLILTGIIQDSDTSEVDKVPILGDIPLLGRLFRRESINRERREVVVIVTPQILDDSDQADEPTFGYQYTPSPEAQKLLQSPR